MSTFCASCGTALRSGAVFCPQCGTPASARTATTLPGQGSRRPVYLAIVVLIVALGATGWIYRDKIGGTAGFSLSSLEQITLVANDSKGVLFQARQGSSFKIEDTTKAARQQCLKPWKDNPGECIIAILPSRSEDYPLPPSSLEVATVNLKRAWKQNQFIALYIYDPDDTGTRADELLVVDCAASTEVATSKTVVCKGTPQDPISRDWRRADAAADEAASRAASDAANDAMAAAEAAARAAEMGAADNVEMPAEEAMPFDGDTEGAVGPGVYVIADANLRKRPTSASSNLGRVPRGRRLLGDWMTGEDGESRWFRLADGTGFVSSVNLSSTAPPRLSTNLGEYAFRPSQDLQLHAQASEMSSVVDTVPPGTLLILTGITANGFAEAKGRRGGVGYFESSGYDFGRR